MLKGSQHAAAVAATLPRSQSSSNAMIASPDSAPVATSEDVFGGNSQAAASSSSGRRQQRLSRGSLSKVSPSPLPSGSYTSQQPQQQQQQHRWQRQMKKGPRHHRGGGRREAQLKRLPGSSVCVTGMSTGPNAVKSAVGTQAQLTLSSSITGTAISDGNKADPSASFVPSQQPQQQRPVDESKRTKGKRDSKPRKAPGGASRHLWEDVHAQPKPRRHLESQQNRRRIPARGSEASAVVGSVQGLAAEPEEKEGTVSRKPRRESVFSSPATRVATAAEGTLEKEELQPPVGTRRVARRSAKDLMDTPSRRPAVREGGGRSRHRRRLSPAHPVASSPAVSRDGSINDAVGGAVVDKLTQPFSTLWHVPPDSAEAVSEDESGRPLHAGNRQSRKPRHMSTSVQQAQPPSGSGAAAGMSPVTTVASFSTRPLPVLLAPQDPIIVAQQMRYTVQAVVAESALPDPPSTAMQLAEFSPAKGSITDLCVDKAVLPKSADVATHALDPALLHSDPAKDMATPSSPSPPVVVSASLPQHPQQSEEDKQLSRRGLRFGALPFYPTSTASLVLAMNPAASTNGGDASLSSFGTTVPSPQSLLGSYSMSPLRSPPLTHPTSSPQGDSMRNHSRSSTGGLMSGQSTFAAELTAATATPWPLTVIAPSHSSPSSSIGRDDTDFDATSSGTSVPIKFPGHRAAMRRSALMVTNTATGACVSPATVVTPSGSPTALWNGSSGHGLKRRTSWHTSGASSITTAAAATSPGGTGYHSATHSGSTPEGGVVREFPQAPCLVVSCTTELHQSQQQQPHSIRSPRLMSESDLDCVQHNRVAVSDVVAKDEGTLVDTLFADVNMIEDDESEVDGEDLLSSRGGGERRPMQPVPSSVASVGGSPLLASPPDVRSPHSATQQLQHRTTPFSVGALVLGKEAGGQVFGGGYWYPSGPWAGTDATGGGGGNASTGTGSYRGGSGDVKTTLATAATASVSNGSGAVAWRGLSTPTHRSRAFSASCASVASTMSLIDPKQPQVDGAAYDMMGEDDEWEINSSAYADSLDEAQIQWIEEQLRATENPAGYF